MPAEGEAGSGRVRVGVVVLPEHPGRSGTAVWRRVEELGADHAWTFDHLWWRTLTGRPWFDAMTTLAAAAGVTERMALGTLVASPNFRHPVTTAQAAMTLDHLSGGRFVLGVGAGGPGGDSGALGGAPMGPAERATRFEEFVTLTDLLLRQPETTWHGRFYDAVGVHVAPGCVQRPRLPFAVAATGPRGMRLAARLGDVWVTNGDPGRGGEQPEDVVLPMLRRQVDRLRAACDDVGRDPAGLRRLVNLSRLLVDPYASPERFADAVGRCADLGFTDVLVAHPRADGVFAGDVGAFEKALTHVTGPNRRDGRPDGMTRRS